MWALVILLNFGSPNLQPNDITLMQSLQANDLVCQGVKKVEKALSFSM